MTIDRSLLDETIQSGLPTLRIFSWIRPTVSLGRHQSLEEFRKTGRVPAGWDAIVRPTGGGAVYHDQDTCFSLSWRDDGSLLSRSLTRSYREIHEIVQSALKRLGISTIFQDAKSPWDPRSVCFSSPTTDDLLQNGVKMVGGAQYRHAGCVLHQGSIQLACSANLSESLRTAFEEQWRVRSVPSALPGVTPGAVFPHQPLLS